MATIARFTMTLVTGFSAALMTPTRTVAAASEAPALSKACTSACWRPNARITRTPSRCSPARRAMPSCPACMPPYMGTVLRITAYSTSTISGVDTRNTRPICALMVKAMTMEPMARNGARTARRMNMFTPVCTWLASLVRRVMRESVPTEPYWLRLRAITRENSLRRRLLPKPCAHTAAKYWQVSAQPRPTAPSPSMARPWVTI